MWVDWLLGRVDRVMGVWFGSGFKKGMGFCILWARSIRAGVVMGLRGFWIDFICGSGCCNLLRQGPFL